VKWKGTPGAVFPIKVGRSESRPVSGIIRHTIPQFIQFVGKAVDAVSELVKEVKKGVLDGKR
jgi:hypothetical protein